MFQPELLERLRARGSVEQHQLTCGGLGAHHRIHLNAVCSDSAHETLDPERIDLLVTSNSLQRDDSQVGDRCHRGILGLGDSPQFSGQSVDILVVLIDAKTDAEAVERVARETAELGDGDKNTSKDEETTAEETASVAKPANLLFIVFVSAAAISIGGAIAATTGRLAIAPWITYVAAAGLITLSVFEFLRVRPDHPFRDGRFTFFIFILIPVQTLFAHVWLTVPYYLDRAFRGSVVSDYFEFFSNINPIVIFIVAPIVAGLTARANVYTMMIIGTLVMALPTFLLVIGPHLVPFLAYILLMSIGEAMWQPRFLQWIAEVAPPGKTGLYMGIGQFPWFLTKFVTGLYSGYFVATYIPRPETGLPTNTEVMWLIYGVIAMISPIALILARKWMMAGMMEKHQG